MTTRYTELFERLGAKNEGAFVPFIMLNDPTFEDSYEILVTAIEAGADALELGLPFSDPVADGPTIQKTHIRAIDGGATFQKSLDLIHRVRSKYPDVPMGMLVYANVPYVKGLEEFYSGLHEAGADSVLIPDVPVREGQIFAEAAERNGIDQIFIAPARASEATLEGVAARSKGYIYAVSRDGVTGTEHQSETVGLKEVVDNIQRFGGAPVLLGFGISSPQHVADAVAAGAAGAISGSAVAKIIDKYVEGAHPNPGRVTDMDSLKKELRDFISAMKAATRK